MDIGTIEPTIDSREIRRRRVGLTSDSGPDGGSGRNGSGGDDGSDNRSPFELIPNKAKVFTTFLLVVVLMTFGGLSAAYIVTATNKAIEWRPFDLPIQVWISTIISLSAALFIIAVS